MIMRATNTIPDGYELLYLEINIFCVVLLMILTFLGNELKGIRWHRILNCCFAFVSVCFITDALWVMMLDGTLPMQATIFFILKGSYFFSVCLMGYFWFLYSENVVNHRFEEHPGRMKYFAVLCGIEGVLLIVNWFHPVLFGMNQDGVYTRGPLFLLQYLLAYIYVIAASADALRAAGKDENYAEKDTCLLHASFPLAPAAAGIIQYFLPSIPVLCCCITIVLLLIHLKAMSSLVSLDPLTQLNNRRRLLLQLPDMIHNPMPDTDLWILMMDLDGFKQINDTYGHLKGDQALCQTAAALKKASDHLKKRAVIARYGGDEFIMIARLTGQENIIDLMIQIQNAVADTAEDHPDAIRLGISIGCAHWEEGMSIQELINEADRNLYREKRKKHAAR